MSSASEDYQWSQGYKLQVGFARLSVEQKVAALCELHSKHCEMGFRQVLHGLFCILVGKSLTLNKIPWLYWAVILQNVTRTCARLSRRGLFVTRQRVCFTVLFCLLVAYITLVLYNKWQELHRSEDKNVLRISPSAVLFA